MKARRTWRWRSVSVRLVSRPWLLVGAAYSSGAAPVQPRVTTVQLRGGHPLAPPGRLHGLHACTLARSAFARSRLIFFPTWSKPGGRSRGPTVVLDMDFAGLEQAP